MSDEQGWHQRTCQSRWENDTRPQALPSPVVNLEKIRAGEKFLPSEEQTNLAFAKWSAKKIYL